MTIDAARSEPGERSELDRFDRAILAMYALDTNLVSEEIGVSIGLSATAVQRRIKKMRADGIIQGEVAKLDALALGFPITCVVCVDIECDRTEQIDQFKRHMLTLPNVQHCYYVTGQWDFMLIVSARDMIDYERFTRQALMNNANVKSFSTHVVMDTVKAGFSLPLG